MQYRVTLDSLRQVSRSVFSGTQERRIQRNITVRESECTKHFFYMLASKSYIIANLFQIRIKHRCLLSSQSNPTVVFQIIHHVVNFILFTFIRKSQVRSNFQLHFIKLSFVFSVCVIRYPCIMD